MNDHKDMANDYIYHTPGFFGILTRYLFELLLIVAGGLMAFYVIIKVIKWLWLL